MMVDAAPFSRIRTYGASAFKYRALASFIAFLETKLGGSFVYDLREIPFARDDLSEPLSLAATLKKAGVIDGIEPTKPLCDEPPMRHWSIGLSLAEHNGMRVTGARGCDASSDTNALYSGLSEALERHIWTYEKDYFDAPIEATESTMQKRRTPHLPPASFAGFGPEQRRSNERMVLSEDASYLWIRGTSLVSGKKVYAPAQTVSGVHLDRNEPLIQPRVTTGLATWMDTTGARLRGVLEAIERDAYMIFWANQLTLPRIDIRDLCARSKSLHELVARCERYGFKVHALRLPTDAPTHVVSVIIEDVSGHVPRFAMGNRAGRDLAANVEHALLEALGARFTYRNFFLLEGLKEGWNPQTPPEKIGHVDRLYWWGEGDRARGLEFLITGRVKHVEEAAWEHDTDEAHLARVIEWCRERKYECVSFDLGRSRSNPTSLAVEMVVIPELQPLHVFENQQALFGMRIEEVPRIFGYESRQKPFSEAPHPFC